MQARIADAAQERIAESVGRSAEKANAEARKRAASPQIITMRISAKSLSSRAIDAPVHGRPRERRFLHKQRLSRFCQAKRSSGRRRRYSSVFYSICSNRRLEKSRFVRTRNRSATQIVRYGKRFSACLFDFVRFISNKRGLAHRFHQHRRNDPDGTRRVGQQPCLRRKDI